MNKTAIEFTDLPIADQAKYLDRLVGEHVRYVTRQRQASVRTAWDGYPTEAWECGTLVERTTIGEQPAIMIYSGREPHWRLVELSDLFSIEEADEHDY